MLSSRNGTAVKEHPLVFNSGTRSEHTTLQTVTTTPLPTPIPTTTMEVEPTELEVTASTAMENTPATAQLTTLFPQKVSKAMDVPTRASMTALVSGKDMYNRLLGMVKLLNNGRGQSLIVNRVTKPEYTTLQTVSTTSLPTPIPTTTMEVEPTEFKDRVTTTTSATLTSSPAARAAEEPQRSEKVSRVIDVPTPASLTTFVPRNALYSRLRGMVKQLSSRNQADANKPPLVFKTQTQAEYTTLQTVSTTSLPTPIPTTTMEVEPTEFEDRVTTTPSATHTSSPAARAAEEPQRSEKVSRVIDAPTPASLTTFVPRNALYSRLLGMVKQLSTRSRADANKHPLVFKTQTQADRLTTESMAAFTTTPDTAGEEPGRAEEVSTAMDVPTPAPVTTPVPGTGLYSRLRDMVKLLSFRNRIPLNGHPVVFQSGTASEPTTLPTVSTTSPPTPIPTTTMEFQPTELEDIVTTSTPAPTTTFPAAAETEESGRVDEVATAVNTPTTNPLTMAVSEGQQGLYNRLLGVVKMLSMRKGVFTNGHPVVHQETTPPTTTTTTTTSPATEEIEEAAVPTSTTLAPVTVVEGGQGVYSRLIRVFKMLSARTTNRSNQGHAMLPAMTPPETTVPTSTPTMTEEVELEDITTAPSSISATSPAFEYETTTTTTEEAEEAEEEPSSTTIAPVTTKAVGSDQGVYSRLIHVYNILTSRTKNRSSQAATTTSLPTTTTTTEEPGEAEEEEEAGGSEEYEYEY
ncbi:mucin-5AC-like [Haliotis rufescens]|uniref:mucin-5AC-like n=1 Tax=Haliotis rufescens TaxID=6454 RepID=UPI00201F64BE|nr:mucin-5AC-like [Haliotis rufescens]